MREKMRVLFRDAFIRNIVIVSLAALIILPSYVLFRAYPSMEKTLISYTEDDAVRIATHLSNDMLRNELEGILWDSTESTRGPLPGDLPEVLESMKKDFKIRKLKIFSRHGQIVYSTDHEDIGRVNKERYFHEIVARGKNYSKVVRKETKSQDGHVFGVDVVETYVPIVRNNAFIGAFEIYLDITDRKKLLDSLISQSLMIMFAIAFCLMVAVVITALRAGRNIEYRKQAEEKISRLNEELEQKVAERTGQLLKAQEELLCKEKLSILGQLSGSVGHELRNPLGVINNAVYFLKTVMADADDTVKEYLDIIRDEINNSERIISDLLDFSRTRPPQIQAVAVNELLNQCMERCAIPEGISVTSDIPHTLSPIKVDPFQMGQVFQNLIINACQAMPEGGSLHIAACLNSEVRMQNAELTVETSQNAECKMKNAECGVKSPELRKSGSEDSAICNLNSAIDGDILEVFVSDTGEGISSENMKKLFQPLFTTKANGIGLGLVVCKNLTEANGGRIEATSELGKGTTFTVKLPKERNGA